jgi:hypothetical protein
VPTTPTHLFEYGSFGFLEASNSGELFNEFAENSVFVGVGCCLDVCAVSASVRCDLHGD